MHYLEARMRRKVLFQDDPATSDMLLTLYYGIFYEFIPVEEVVVNRGGLVTIQQVEKDRNYALVISTCGDISSGIRSVLPR